MKRSIRLKEWGVNVNLTKRPSIEYSKIRDDCPVKDYRFSTDSQGFIISRNGFSEDESTASFFFIGDSFVESMFIEEGFRFHSSLERKLWAAGEKIKCYNAGYSGATSLHLINSILNKVVPLRPDVVFYVIPSNDAFSLEVNSGVWGRSKVTSPFVPHDTGFVDIEFQIKEVRSLIKCIHEILLAFRIRLVFLTFPHRHGEYSGKFLRNRFISESKYYRTRENRLIVNEVLRNYCSRRKAEFIDLENLMDPFENLSQDDLHLNSEGSMLLSDILYSWIINYA